MYHIKEGSKTLCGKRIDKNKITTISLYSASRASLYDCCPICCTKYKDFLRVIENVKEDTNE
jgi:hypothetical protein